MSRKHWIGATPTLLLGAGILVSTGVAVWAADFGWLALTAPVLLALSVAGADVLDSRLRGEASGPSRAALIVGASVILAGAIVTLRDPGLVRTLIPVMGPPCGSRF